MKTFDISGEGLYEHNAGNLKCDQGWCGNDFPKRCGCGGLIYDDFGDEDLVGK